MPSGTSDRAGVHEGVLAGRQALASGAWEQAREAFAQVGTDVPEALEGLGWSYYWLGEVERSLELREQACRTYREGGECRAAARVAISLALDSLDTHGEAVSTGWLELARRMLEGLERSPEHGWLILWEGHFARFLRNDMDEARRLGAKASAIGRELQLADLELLGTALEGLVQVNEGEVREGMRRLDGSMAAALVGEMNDLNSVAVACCFLLHACEWVGDYNRMAQWATRVDQFADRWNISSMFVACKTQHAAMLIGRGEWSKAESMLEAANDQLLRTRPWLVPDALEQLGELRRRQGRWDQAEEMFAKTGARTVALLGRGHMALDRGNAAEAIELVDRALRHLSLARRTDWAIGLLLSVRARLRQGQIDRAREAADRLGEIARTVGTKFTEGIALQAEGLLALQSDAQLGRRKLEDSVAVLEHSGAPYETARARIEVACALRELDQLGAARREASTAQREFGELGARWDIENAEALLGELDSAPPEVESPLSPREAQVLGLVAEGLGDKEIARDLCISEHTVHRHVSNILTKLDKPSRAAAVAHAVRNGLL